MNYTQSCHLQDSLHSDDMAHVDQSRDNRNDTQVVNWINWIELKSWHVVVFKFSFYELKKFKELNLK